MDAGSTNVGDLYSGKTILITGGTGSLGHALVERFLKTDVRRIIIYSRDEYKQYHMEQKFSAHRMRLRFFLGDVRDRQRLYRAFVGVDYVIHAAALKHVHLMEYNQHEAVQTNIVGAMNILDAAIDRGVTKVVALSTDKAVNPRARLVETGIRPGEKLHGVMLTEDEARSTFDYGDHYVVYPLAYAKKMQDNVRPGGTLVPREFRYASDTNDQWLSPVELTRLLGQVTEEEALAIGGHA